MFGEIRQKFREQGAKRVKFSPYSERLRFFQEKRPFRAAPRAT